MVSHNLLRIQNDFFISLPWLLTSMLGNTVKCPPSPFLCSRLSNVDCCGDSSQIQRGLVIYVCFFKGADKELLPKMGMCFLPSPVKGVWGVGFILLMM